MLRNDVRTPASALAYITDCTLATVADMAILKSRKKYEFNRQIMIAQTAIDWMKEMSISYESTRAIEVDKVGSVKKWAESFMPENSTNT
jgi:hypothetical protein